MASLGSVSLLGESAVDITPAPSGTPIPEWGYVPSRPRRGQHRRQLTPTGDQGLDAATTADRKTCAQGKGTIGKLFTDDAALHASSTTSSTPPSASRARSPTARARSASCQRSEGCMTSSNASLENLNAITDQLATARAASAQLLNDPAFAQVADVDDGEPRNADRPAEQRRGHGRQAADRRALYKRLNSVAARLDTVLQELKTGEGTAGQLLHDKQLYENMNQSGRRAARR